jgi:hypothetical protein
MGRVGCQIGPPLSGINIKEKLHRKSKNSDKNTIISQQDTRILTSPMVLKCIPILDCCVEKQSQVECKGHKILFIGNAVLTGTFRFNVDTHMPKLIPSTVLAQPLISLHMTNPLSLSPVQQAITLPSEDLFNPS